MAREDAPQIKDLPHHEEAERVLLGAMLLDSANIGQVVLLVEPSDFFLRPNQLIYSAILGLYEEDQSVDSLLLSDELIRRGEIQEAGGYEYLNDLVEGIPRLPNINYYAQIVKDKAQLRKLAIIGRKVTQEAVNAKQTVAELIDLAETQIYELREGRTAHGFQTLSDTLEESYKIIEERAARKGELAGLTTGFIDFDRMTSGMQKGDLVIVAARPAMGKTSFCLNMAVNAAKTGARVTVFSLEMPATQLAMRLLGSEARVGISELRAGRLDDEEWARVGAAMGTLSQSQILIEDSGESTVAQMRAQLKRLKRDGPVDMVIIDYLQLMTGSAGNAQQSRVQEVSAISRGLKILAKEVDAPVIALSQLSRAAEQRSDHRPQLSDLRESGSIEQDADMVCFLFREDYYKEKKKEDEKPIGDDEFGIAELIIAKHRNGPTGKIELAFFKKFTRFENYSDEVEF